MSCITLTRESIGVARALPRYNLLVHQYFEPKIGQWSERRKLTQWTVPLSDLCPLDFFFSRHLKSKVYHTPTIFLTYLR